jgi:hypothetical protein
MEAEIRRPNQITLFRIVRGLPTVQAKGMVTPEILESTDMTDRMEQRVQIVVECTVKPKIVSGEWKACENGCIHIEDLPDADLNALHDAIAEFAGWTEAEKNLAPFSETGTH